MASRPGAPGGPSITARSTTDPILRNALRYTISAREYATLHKYVISRSRTLKRHAPSVDTVQRIMDGTPPKSKREKRKGEGKGCEEEDKGVVTGADGGADDYNARAIRHSIRVFVATGALIKLWEVVAARVMRGKKEYVTKSIRRFASKGTRANYVSPSSVKPPKKKQPLHKSPTLRLSLSLSTILLMYRLLFRFFTRLRAHLLDPAAAPFRTRNPKTASTLTSPYAPAVGASLAGLALGVYPSRKLRVTIALYTVFRALEFGWNCAEDNGMVWGWEKGLNGKPDRKRARPAWWGSWMLQPLAMGQLFHAVVFDRDCVPEVSSTRPVRENGG